MVRFQHDKMFLQAIKSYKKKKWKYTYHVLYYFDGLGYMKDMRKIRCWWLPDLEGTCF